MILKILLVLFLVYFLIFRFFGILLRPFLSVLFSDPRRNYQSGDFNRGGSYKKAGDLNIDHVPEDKKNKKDFDGGEYVDFEEVK